MNGELFKVWMCGRSTVNSAPDPRALAPLSGQGQRGPGQLVEETEILGLGGAWPGPSEELAPDNRGDPKLGDRGGSQGQRMERNQQCPALFHLERLYGEESRIG